MSKTVRRWLQLAVLAWVVYPLAYAPLIRLLCGEDMSHARVTWVLGRKVITVEMPSAPTWTMAFLPVQFLASRTPFGYPLQLWAEHWEVDAQQQAYVDD